MATKEYSGGAYASSGGGQYRPPATSAPKKTTLVKTSSKGSTERYAKPAAMAGLPGWAKDIRAGSQFMPTKIKPVSYNYMALVESPNRKGVYSPPVQQTQTTVGSFFKPTEDVAAKVKQESNLWQDIKNIGGKIVHKGGSLLMGALDVLARPRYMLMDMVKTDIERDYTGADGKDDVTGWEAMLGIAKNLTPVGVIQDIFTGQLDDRIKSGWNALSGVSKTGTKDILNVTNPEFVKEHPGATNWLSLGGDILFDPITWVTMGANPGSVVRGVGAGSKLLVGNKAAAARLWDETIFTKAGRASGRHTVKLDAINKELKSLNRKENRAKKGLTRIEQGKKTKLEKAQYEARVADVSAKLKQTNIDDLKGAALASLIFKKNLPTLGIMAASRFNTGAGATTALKGAALAQKLAQDFHIGIAGDLGERQSWKAFYEANKGQDIVYTHAGQQHVVKLEGKSFDDFMYTIVSESAPLAAYAEHGHEAARTRAMRQQTIEAKGQAFRHVLGKHMEDTYAVGMGKEYAKKMDDVRGIHGAVRDAANPTDAELSKLGVLKFTEDELVEKSLSHAKLKKMAGKEWKKAHPGKPYNDERAYILLKGADDKYRKVSIAAVGKHSRANYNERRARVQERKLASERSRERVAVDTMTGTPENVAGARQRYIKLAQNIRNAHELEEAANIAKRKAAMQDVEGALATHRKAADAVKGRVLGTTDDANITYSNMKDIITKNKGGDFTEEEIAKYSTILAKTDLPIEERIAMILNDAYLSTEEVNEILADVFKVHIDNKGVIHVSKGGDYGAIPDIIKAVIRDRFKTRISPEEITASGVSLHDMPEQDIFRVVHDTSRTGEPPKYGRDVNGEIGMMVLDGYRAAIEYANKNALWEDPEALFATINGTMTEFVNHASADIKQQVFNLMYNASGMRLPENFVPTGVKIENLIGKKGFKFKSDVIDKKTGKPKELNQEIPWQNLGILMQSWVEDTFSFIPPVKVKGVAQGGNNMDNLGAEIEKLADSTKKVTSATKESEDKLAEIRSLLPDIARLADSVGEAKLNGDISVVNRYNFVDFIIHSKSIVESQKTTVHIAEKTTNGLTGVTTRVNSGRLSALDSFTFVDEQNQKGLLALTKLKNMTKSDDAETAMFAQRELAKLFVDNGGLDHIASLRAPNGGSLYDIDFAKQFSTLGTHVRLKETTARKGFEGKFSADLLESMWDTESVIHEWQKAAQNKIMHDVFVTGMTPEESAKQMAKNTDEFFSGYEKIKKIIYPVADRKLKQSPEDIAAGLPKERVVAEYSEKTKRIQQEKLQEQWGPNEIETLRNKPIQEVTEPAAIEFPKDIDPDTATVKAIKTDDINAVVNAAIRNGDVKPGAIKPGKAGEVDKAFYVLQKFGFGKVQREFMLREIGEAEEVSFVLVNAKNAKGVEGSRGIVVKAKGKNDHKLWYFPIESKEKFGTPKPLDRRLSAEEAAKKGLQKGETTKEERPSRYTPSQYGTKPVLNKKLAQDIAPGTRKVTREVEVDLEPFTGKKGFIKETAPDVQNLLDARAAEQELKEATDRLKAAMARVAEGPKTDPAALSALRDARNEYEAAKAAAKGAKDTAQPTPEVPATAPEDPADFANIQPYAEFTEEEKKRIVEFIGLTYGEAKPAEVAREMHTMSLVMANDLWFAQQKLIGELSDVGIKHNARVKFMGIPFMPIKNLMNSTHSVAGLTAFDLHTSRATKFWSGLTDAEAGSKFGKDFSMRFSRQSQYLEGRLEQIRMETINYANMSRMEVIRDLDNWYDTMHTADYSVPSLNGMKPKAKLNYIKNALFTPTPKGAPDALNQFNVADGTNPVKAISDSFEDNAITVFPAPPKDLPPANKVGYRLKQIESFNRYIHEKYRLNTGNLKETNLLAQHMHDGKLDPNLTPYSREWLQAVGSLLPSGSKLHLDKLKSANLGELHFLMYDAKLKLQAGEALHKGVFGQFTVKMTPDALKFHNDNIGSMVDAKGNLLREDMISVKDLQEEFGIAEHNIPKEFLNVENKEDMDYYIPRELITPIKTLFNYMEEIHKLNDSVNIGMLDKILGYFKASVTIYNVPTYPIRNLISDVFMSAMDGVVNPKVYKEAIDLMMSHHNTLKNLKSGDFAKILDQNFLRKEALRATHNAPTKLDAPAAERTTPWNMDLELQSGRVRLNGSQVMESFYAAGLGQNRVSGDVALSLKAARQTGSGRKAGKVHDLLRDSNEIREDWTRIAHYLHVIRAEAPLGGTIEDVIRRATIRVKRHHFDYNDISLVDRKVLGRVLPFYKWMKNIIPFTIASLVARPWAIRAEQAIQQSVGFMMDGDEDRRTDYVLPEWIEYDSAVQIGEFNEEGHDFGQWASMYLPLSDTMKNFLHPMINPAFDQTVPGPRNKIKEMGEGALQVTGSSLNPALKAIIQGMTNREVWDSGPAAEKGDWIDALLPIVPGYAMADQLQGKLVKLGEEDLSTGKSSVARGLEYLGVMNVHDNTENAQLGEMNKREDFYRGQLDTRKAELMNRIQKKYPETTPDVRKEIVDRFLKMTRAADPERL